MIGMILKSAASSAAKIKQLYEASDSRLRRSGGIAR